jgi:pimeloyl-ACP methyl ester carboxylesterase
VTVSSSELVNLGNGMVGRTAPGNRHRVLWIHGYTLDSTAWSELWELLPEWSHIAIDLPGHGGSPPMVPGEDLPTLARRIAEIALKHNARHLVGLSFGALIALQVAIELREFLATLTLGAPSLGGGPQELGVGVRFEELKKLFAKTGNGPELRKLWMTSPPNIFAGAEKRKQLWERLCRIVDRHQWSELSDSSMEILANHVQREDDLRKIKAATLILLGEDEMSAFKRCAELIRRSIPNCKRLYIADVGHLCMLEDPKAVQTIIRDHLSGHNA